MTFVSDTPNFTFKNNIVMNKRNRGILIQIPDALIENNTFINVGHGSIQAASSMDQFNECTLAQGIVIRNNKFISNCTIKPGPLYATSPSLPLRRAVPSLLPAPSAMS